MAELTKGRRGGGRSGGVARRATSAGERQVRRGASAASKSEAAARDAAPVDLEDEPTSQVEDGGDGESGSGSGGSVSVREELASIVREAALEVLSPVARRATLQAAKYALSHGPQYATETLVPKLRDSVAPAVRDAGGVGPLARTTLSALPGRGKDVLGRAGIGGERGGEAKEPKESKRRLPLQMSVDIAAPLEDVYDAFSHQVDTMKTFREGDIVHEEECARIEWESGGGGHASAVITFHRLSDRLTRVMVSYEAGRQGIVDTVTSSVRMVGRSLRSDLARLKADAELGDAFSDGSEDAAGARDEDDREEDDREEDDRDEDDRDEDDRDEDDRDAEDEGTPHARGEDTTEDEAEDPVESEDDDEPEEDDDDEDREEAKPAPRRRPAKARAKSSPRSRQTARR